MKPTTSPPSVQPSTNRRCDGTTVDGCETKPSMSGTWFSTSCRATRTDTSSLHPRWAICRRGSTSVRRLQVEDHRRRCLHQCLEHRAAMSFLPLINAYFSLSVFVFKNPRSLVTSDPFKLQGVGPHSGADISDTSTFILQTQPVLPLQIFSKKFSILLVTSPKG